MTEHERLMQIFAHEMTKKDAELEAMKFLHTDRRDLVQVMAIIIIELVAVIWILTK